MPDIRKITKAQWMMILITILSTIIINVIVSSIMVFMIDDHINRLTLVECEDRMYNHITERATGGVPNQILGDASGEDYND